MSGSENSNSSSPRYCPTPHQMPVPSGSPPPNAMMHQVMPGHGHGHGHHMQPQHSQSMAYYGYHNQTATHQQNYYAPQSPNANYYGMQHPHPSHSPAPQYVQQQATQWQTHVHQQGYYNPGYPPQTQQQSSYAPQHSPHHQQIPVTVAGGNTATYEMGLAHNLGPPSNHTINQSHQHVVSTSDSSGQHPLMNLSRFVSVVSQSDTQPQNQNPNPSHGGGSGSSTTIVNNTANSSISSVSSLSSNSNGSPRPDPIRSPGVAVFPSNPGTTTVPPPLPSASATNGGQTGMMPVRLQNMAKGARTKASMRKMMLEQQTSANSSVENHDNILEEPPKKRMRRKPRSKEPVDEAGDTVNSLPEEPIAKKPRKPRTPKNKTDEASKFEESAIPVIAKKAVQNPRRSNSKSPAHVPPPALILNKRVYSPDVTEMREKDSGTLLSPKKKRGRRPKFPVPEQSEQKGTNNVEEEIAHVLLDLQTGKSSPEKPKEEPSTSSLREPDSDVILGDSVVKKRKRQSPVKPIEVEATQSESKEKEASSAKRKNKKVPKSKKVVKVEKLKEIPARRKNSRKSSSSLSDHLTTPNSDAAMTPSTPRKRRIRNSPKSKTLPSSSSITEPYVFPSEIQNMTNNTLSEFAETEFPVIHIPETAVEGSILVKAKIELPRLKEIVSKPKLGSSSKSKVDSLTTTSKPESYSNSFIDSPPKSKNESPLNSKSDATSGQKSDSSFTSRSDHSHVVIDPFPKPATEYLPKLVSDLTTKSELVPEHKIDLAAESNFNAFVKPVEESPFKSSTITESPTRTKLQSPKQKIETLPIPKVSKAEASSKLKTEIATKSKMDIVVTPKVETTPKPKARRSSKETAVNKSKTSSPSKQKVESPQRVKKERKKSVRKKDIKEKPVKSIKSKSSRKSRVEETTELTQNGNDVNVVDLMPKSVVDVTLDFPVLSIPEDLSPATVSIPTQQGAKINVSKPKRSYKSKKSPVVKAATTPTPPSKKGARASKRKEIVTPKDSPTNAEPTIILDSIEVHDFPVMSIAENDSTITITAATVINAAIPETKTKKKRTVSPKRSKSPRQLNSVKEDVKIEPSDVVPIVPKKSRSRKRNSNTATAVITPENKPAAALESTEPAITVSQDVSSTANTPDEEAVPNTKTPTKGGSKSKAARPGKKARQLKNARLSSPPDMSGSVQESASSAPVTQREITKVIQSRSRLSRSPSVSVIEPEASPSHTPSKKRERSKDGPQVRTPSPKRRKTSKAMIRNAIDDIIESVVKVPEATFTPKSTSHGPTKKRVSVVDRAKLDIIENETINEVSTATDKPLPDLEFYYQFEYSQRNNYPPSLPAPGKRKHAILEARKHEIMSELSRLNGAEAVEVETDANSLKTETLADIVVPSSPDPEPAPVSVPVPILVPAPVPVPVPIQVPEPVPVVITVPEPISITKIISLEENTESKLVEQASSSSKHSYIDFIPALAKPLKKPSVFVKSMPLASANTPSKSELKVNDFEAGTMDKVTDKRKSKKDSKNTQENKAKQEKRTSHVGPSLRVKDGVVKFYRGSDEEDVDVPVNKLRAERPTETYDSSVPWLCSFCHLGPHTQRLGDLFGPYYVNTSEDSLEEITPGVSSNSKTVMDGYKRSVQLLQKRETWMHQDCALWAGGVVLIGTSIRGLDKAVYDANSISCSICKEKGAMIGCLRRGCDLAAHFPCAQRSHWNLDEDTFHSYCEMHSKF